MHGSRDLSCRLRLRWRSLLRFRRRGRGLDGRCGGGGCPVLPGPCHRPDGQEGCENEHPDDDLDLADHHGSQDFLGQGGRHAAGGALGRTSVSETHGQADSRLGPGGWGSGGRAAERGPGNRQGGVHAASFQPGLQLGPTACQPALDRPQRRVEPGGGLFLRQAFQVAEDQRGAESLGQPAEVLVEGRPALSVFRRRKFLDQPACGHRGPSALVGASSSGGDAGLGRDAQRHAVQPAADRLAPADRAGPARQDQERRLRGVLGVVVVAQDLPADAQDHRRMTIDQRRESRLVPMLDESLEQLAVGQSAGRAGPEECFDLLEELHGWIGKTPWTFDP